MVSDLFIKFHCKMALICSTIILCEVLLVEMFSSSQCDQALPQFSVAVEWKVRYILHMYP